MRKSTRLGINLLLVGVILLVGAQLAPRIGTRVSSPGNGGIVVKLPDRIVEGTYMYRGQSMSLTFWGQTCPGENITMLPVDCYIMNLEQYLSFTKNNSRQSLLHMNSTVYSLNFNAERNDYYFLVLEMAGPEGVRRCIGYYLQTGGLNLNFLQPAQILLVTATAILMYNIFQWLTKRGDLPLKAIMLPSSHPETNCCNRYA